MKKEFSPKWKASRQRRKQRKYRYNAPLHTARKFFSANLAKELRKKYSRRNFGLRKGDVVRVMRGEFRGRKGKVLEINTMKERVYIEGLQKAKRDGTKINVSVNPSKLQISELNLEDKKRIRALERKVKK